MSKHTPGYEVTRDGSAAIKASNQAEGTRKFRRKQRSMRNV